MSLAFACLLLVTGSYGLACWIAPYGRCRKCRGWGHAIKTDRRGRPKRGKDCRRCHALGIRLRIGRRAYNGLARLYRDDAKVTAARARAEARTREGVRR